MPPLSLIFRSVLRALALAALLAFSAAAVAADDPEAAFAKFHAAALEAGLGGLMLPKNYTVVGKTMADDGNRATLQLSGSSESLFSGAMQAVSGTATLAKENGEWTVKEMSWGSGGGAKPAAKPEAVKLPVAATPAQGPAAGRVHGAEFVVEKASLSRSDAALRLELNQGKGFFADKAFEIVHFIKQGEAIEGLRLVVEAAGDKFGNPHIGLKYKVEGKTFPESETFFEGYALTLEFGARVGKVIQGRVDLRLPDKAASFVSGTFAAEME